MWVPHPLRPTCPSYMRGCLLPQRVGFQTSNPHIHPHHTVGAPSFAAHMSVLHARLLAAAKGGFPNFQPSHSSPPHCGCPILCGPHVRPACPAACCRKGWVSKLPTLTFIPTTLWVPHPCGP